MQSRPHARTWTPFFDIADLGECVALLLHSQYEILTSGFVYDAILTQWRNSRYFNQILLNDKDR